jgi:negative regulator of replication initiation
MEFITNIVKTNENMKQLMIEQMKHHMETEKKLIELIKEPINKDK